MIVVFLALLLAGPEQFDSVFREGLIALNRGDLAGAKDRLESATKLRAGSGEAWAALAQTLFRMQMAEQADRAAEKARAAAPKNMNVLRALLMYYSGRGQPKSAISIAQQALAIENRPEIHNILGKAWLALKEDAKGFAELRDAARLDPTNARFQFDLGQALLQDEDFNAAAEALEIACRQIPTDAQLQLALGVAYYGQRRFSQAVGRFLQTIRLAPETEQPYVFLGKILDHAGERLPEIQAQFAKLLAKNPQDFMAAFLNAKILLAQPGRDSSEAEKLLRTSVVANGKFWESHYELGILLAKKRQFQEAAAQLQSAIELNPKEAAPHYHLARVYDRLGKSDLAAAERATHEKLSAPADVK